MRKIPKSKSVESAKEKTHMYINPETGENVCRAEIAPNERHKWFLNKVNPLALVDCERCLAKKAGIRG